MSSEGSEGRLVRGGVRMHQLAPEPDNLPCPRCSSSNTKFCYYNNYNLSQPRYFCKSCRRYWTRGGSLRNVPVGGGSRKNSKRSRSDPSTAHQQPLPSNSPDPGFVVDSPAPDGANTTPSYQSDAANTTSYQSFTALLDNQQECGFMGLSGYSVGLGLMPDASPTFDGYGFAPAVVGGGHDQNYVGGWGGSSSGCDTWHTEGAEDGGVLTDGGDYLGWPGPTGFQ